MIKYSAKEKILKNIQDKINKYKITKKQKKEFCLCKNDNILDLYNRNKRWILSNTIKNEGIITPYKNVPYPEVSGYYIPSLLEWGFKDLAKQYASWLVSIQHKEGAWYDWANKDPYIFDTGQILKGLIAIYPIMPDVKKNIIKGCEWIINLIEDNGHLQSPAYKLWNDSVSELIHIYCLSPLIEAGRLFNKPEYEQKAKNVLEYYKRKSLNKLLNFHLLSHFYGYIMEAMVDLGEVAIVLKGMENISKLQTKNGLIPAYKNVKWTCSTGLFQMALVWYKIGEKEKANKTFDYACSLQTKNGGWLGSYGKNCSYIPDNEISWANKYFLDALKYRISDFYSSINYDKEYQFLENIKEEDNIIKTILNSTKNKQNILNIGYNPEQLLNIIQNKNRETKIYSVDIGSLLNIPFENNKFDFILEIGTLKYTIDAENAVKELARITSKDGKILIIENNGKSKNKIKKPFWENKINLERLKLLLEESGFNVQIFKNIQMPNCIVCLGVKK